MAKKIEFSEVPGNENAWTDNDDNVTVEKEESGYFRVSNRYKFHGYSNKDGAPLYGDLNDGHQDQIYDDKVAAFSAACDEVRRFRNRR